MYVVMVLLLVSAGLGLVSLGRSDCYVFFAHTKVVERGMLVAENRNTMKDCMEELILHGHLEMVHFNTDTKTCSYSDKDLNTGASEGYLVLREFKNCESLPTRDLCVSSPRNVKPSKQLDYPSSSTCFEACRLDSTCMTSGFKHHCLFRNYIVPTELSESGYIDDEKIFMKTHPCNETGAKVQENMVETTTGFVTSPFLSVNVSVKSDDKKKSTPDTGQVTNLSTKTLLATQSQPSNILPDETTPEPAKILSSSTGHPSSSKLVENLTQPRTIQYSSAVSTDSEIPTSSTASETSSSLNPVYHTSSTTEEKHSLKLESEFSGGTKRDAFSQRPTTSLDESTKWVSLTERNTGSVLDELHSGSPTTPPTDGYGTSNTEQGSTKPLSGEKTARRSYPIVESMMTVTAVPLRTAHDDRPTAVAIGSFGLVFLCLLAAFILVSDIPKLKNDLFNIQ